MNNSAMDMEDIKPEISRAEKMLEFLNHRAETMVLEEQADARIEPLEKEAIVLRPN